MIRCIDPQLSMCSQEGLRRRCQYQSECQSTECNNNYMHFKTFIRRRNRVIAIAAAIIIFAIDIVTPLGVASAVPYSLVMLLTLGRHQPRFTLTMAGVCSAFTLLDLAFSVGPGSTEYWKVLVNRALALSIIWISAVLGLQRNRAAEEARRHLGMLARMQRDQAVEQYATAIAHELNQPLAACSLQAELALQTLDQPQQLKPLLQEVVEQSQRASAIMRALRALVRTNAVERIDFHPNELALFAERWFEPLSRQHSIRLELSLAQHLPMVRGDRVQLEQVLINLIQNAADALCVSTSEARVITVVTHPVGWDSIPTLPSKECGSGWNPNLRGIDRVKFSVTDNGPGVDAAMCDRLFERFHTSKPQGMGIGLTMSRSLIEAHGGRLWLDAQSHPQGMSGATFSFELPTAGSASNSLSPFAPRKDA